MIKIAVLGYGTIGSGVVEVLETNREHITQTAGQEIEVKYVLDFAFLTIPGNTVNMHLFFFFELLKFFHKFSFFHKINHPFIFL